MNSVNFPLSFFKSSTFSFSLLDEELMLSTVPCKLQLLLSTPCNVFFNVPSWAFRLFEDLMISSRRLRFFLYIRTRPHRLKSTQKSMQIGNNTHSFSISWFNFIVLRKASWPRHPAKCTLHNPPDWLYFKLVFYSGWNINFNIVVNLKSVFKCASIALICPSSDYRRITVQGFFKSVHPSLGIVNICCVNVYTQ